MYINSEMIIEAAALLAAVSAIIGVCYKFMQWIEEQKKQSIDLKNVKEEQSLLVDGILACLDGLQQLGANHTVPQTREKIEVYLNKKAHNSGGE